MGNINKGNTYLLLDFFQLYLHLFSDLGIQGTQGLIQKEHLWLIDQGSGNGNTLLLSSGKKGNISFFKSFQTNHFKHSFYFLTDHRLIHFFQVQTKSNIFRHIQVREERILLKHCIHFSLIGRKLGNFYSVKKNFTITWFFKSGNDSQCSSFTTAAGAKKGQEFLFINIQIDASQNLLIIKILGQIF